MAGGDRLAGSRQDGIFGRDLELTGELPREAVWVLELAGDRGFDPELSTELLLVICWLVMLSPEGLPGSVSVTFPPSGTERDTENLCTDPVC